MIRLSEFSIGYNNRLLLSDISLTFRAGRLTALIGRNGCGKSSLLRTIAGFAKPTEGSVCINELPPNSPSHLMSRDVAFVTTERLRVPNLPCRDVVALGRSPYTNWIGKLSRTDYEVVDKALEAVGMTDYACKSMDKMSDGECQRIMIARALAQSTPVLLLDEPTSFLDLPNRFRLVSMLAELAHQQHKCVLFSTHELDIALSLCDDIALIDSPNMHFMSTTEMSRSGLIQELFGISSVTLGGDI